MGKLSIRAIFLLVELIVLSFPCICLSQSELSKKIEELSDRLTFATEGQVLSREGDIIYIDLGQKNGIVAGNRLEVVRLGEPLMVEGEILGYKETIIGEVEVERVRKKISIARVINKTKDIEKGDKVYQRKKKNNQDSGNRI